MNRRIPPAARFATLVATVFTSLLVLAPQATADHGAPYHWNRNYPTATAVAQIYFEDFTGPDWPVGSMVQEWDDRPNYLRPYYKAADNCNNSVVHCIPVRTFNDPNTNRGLTSYDIDLSTNHVVHGSMLVRFNNAYTYTTAVRREVTCHELGHATGPVAGEGTQDDSCMRGGAPYVDHATPHDYNLIVNTYNH